MGIISWISSKLRSSSPPGSESPSEQPPPTKSVVTEEVIDDPRRERMRHLISLDRDRRNARRQKLVDRIKAKHQPEIDAARQRLYEMGFCKDPSDQKKDP